MLLLNRKQLEKAINGVYGSEVDAHLYLQKFIHLSLRLPKGGDYPSNRIEQYIQYLIFERFGYTPNVVDSWLQSLPICALALDLSLRDLERVVARLIVCNLPPLPINAFAICLRVKNEDWFECYRNSNASIWPTIYSYMTENLRSVDDRSGIISQLKAFVGQWYDQNSALSDDFFGHRPGRSDARELYHYYLSVISTGYRSA